MTTNPIRPWYLSTRVRIVAALFVGVALVGRIIYQNTATGVSVPDKLILYSLDYHEDYIVKGIPKSDDMFRGIPVLGIVEITEPAKQKEIITALNASKAKGKGRNVAKCFYPRHGVRIVEGGHEVDHLICFECHYLQVYLDGILSADGVPISQHAQPVLNMFLNEANVPVSPEAQSPKGEIY